MGGAWVGLACKWFPFTTSLYFLTFHLLLSASVFALLWVTYRPWHRGDATFQEHLSKVSPYMSTPWAAALFLKIVELRCHMVLLLKFWLLGCLHGFLSCLAWGWKVSNSIGFLCLCKYTQKYQLKGCRRHTFCHLSWELTRPKQLWCRGWQQAKLSEHCVQGNISCFSGDFLTANSSWDYSAVPQIDYLTLSKSFNLCPSYLRPTVQFPRRKIYRLT